MAKILVIGESCKDVFVYCNAQRLAPDIPVPVLDVNYITENPGMAMNVKNNIEKLTLDCEIATNDNWEDITKTRYVHEESNHTFIRIDSKFNPKPLNLKIEYSNYDLVVISDYNKGFLSEEAIESICKNHKLVFLDTKKKLGTWASHATFIKINDYEYRRSITRLTPYINDKLIHTHGGTGCTFRGEHYPVNEVNVKDTSGAGDAFLAALVVKFLELEDIKLSIKFANQCASQVVAKRGVALI
jgi:bifunctional ADP-heptose synthase (sugar kinase/adenylyltransferase)